MDEIQRRFGLLRQDPKAIAELDLALDEELAELRARGELEGEAQ